MPTDDLTERLRGQTMNHTTDEPISEVLYAFDMASIDLRAGIIHDRNTAQRERFPNVVARAEEARAHVEEGNRIAAGSGKNYRVRIIFEAC